MPSSPLATLERSEEREEGGGEGRGGTGRRQDEEDGTKKKDERGVGAGAGGSRARVNHDSLNSSSYFPLFRLQVQISSISACFSRS